MEKSAILHIPMSHYAYGVDEEHVTIRLRAKREDLKSCDLYFGDRSCRQTPVIFTKAPMQLKHRTSLYDFFEVTLEKPYKRLCYYFLISDGTEELYYYGDCFCKETVDDRSEYFQLPFNHRADIVNPPKWASHAMIYNIFPDSFATGRRMISEKPTELEWEGQKTTGKLGGTLRGIIENVDYLEELGVNAIYINPIFAAGEYHKYDLLDYYHIDPCFGTNEEFALLVDVYHTHGIKVIIDGVFNHCGWKFFAFEDVVQNGEASKYKDWFYGLQYPVVRPEDPEAYPNYDCFGYERMMPKLNLDNPETANYFIEVGRYWIREFHIDGWRLDVASEINDGFWRAFHKAVKEENPEAILIGEVWESAGHWLDGTIFDSTMNYDFRKHCRRFFAERTIDAMEFTDRVTDMLMRYREQTVYAQLNVLDSHDVSRFLSVCHEDEKLYALALVFQMTFPGMPSVFYGDEQGITGILEKDYRHPMIWDKRNPLFSFFQKLLSLRKGEEVLQTGDFHTVLDEVSDCMYVYERADATDRIRIYLNAGDACKPVEVSETYEVLLQDGYEDGTLSGKGYLILKRK